MRIRISTLLMRAWIVLIATSVFPSLALAGWGDDNWGTLVWGAAVSGPGVPGLGLLGLMVLAMGLAGTAAWTLRKRRPALGLTLIMVLPMLSPVANAQTVPNIFTDGTPALASEVNENFQALASAVNASDCATAADVVCNPSAVSCPACPSCPACDTLGSYNQGFSDGGSEFGNITDNAALCSGAGGTYDAEADACSFDETTDNAAVAAAAGSAACTQVGGTWNAEASTCTPAIGPVPHNCLTTGFCTRAYISLPPADFGYTNVYEVAGFVELAAARQSAGCNEEPGLTQWNRGNSSLVFRGATLEAHFEIIRGFLLAYCSSN